MKVTCDTKIRLIKTAGEMIWENSFGSVSVDDICKRAEVKKGSFYHFFPSKVDLTLEALESGWEEKAPEMDRIFSIQKTVPQRIKSLCKSILQTQTEKKKQFGKVCGCPYLALGLELGTQDERIRQKTALMMDRSARYYEALSRDAQNEGILSPKADARIVGEEVFRFVIGTLAIARMKNDLAPLHGIEQGILRSIGILTYQRAA